jgi:hypothetical protein
MQKTRRGAMIGRDRRVLVANVHDGDCGFRSLTRAASLGSLGQASAQALIGQSPLPAPVLMLLLAVFDSTAESPDASLRLQH